MTWVPPRPASRIVSSHMLETYHKYSNISEFRLNKYSMEDLLDAYHMIKGDFNAIRMEKKLFYDILNSYINRTKTKKKKKDILSQFKNKKVGRSTDPNEESYKKSLRYKAWNMKWDNFRPEVEGIDIDLNVDD
ncbi:hypothetical protein ACJJTC_001691 [Scirpophaga incertulas]